MAGHRFACRVYYEDTDIAGVVYHANYLRFFERGRTEALRAGGVDQGRLKAERGLVFVVRALAVEFLAPAVFDDLIEVTTAVARLTGARAVLDQRIARGAQPLAAATVTLAAMGADGRPVRLPAELRAALAPFTIA